jgi:hypothetical protein
MRISKQIIAVIAFWVMLSNVNAQLNRAVQRGVQRGVERGVERAAEKKAEEAAEKAVTKAIDEAEKNAAEAQAAQEEFEASQAETGTQAAATPAAVIPEVGTSPYTPSEGEYAFFVMKPGAVLVYVSKDGKGKISSQTRNTVKSVTGDKSAFAIAYQSEIFDASGKPADAANPVIVNCRAVIKDGLMYLDMKEMFGSIPGLEGVEVTGTPIKIPNNLSVDQSIDDASASVRIGFVNCTSVMTAGKCVAIEDVTVEAGTFRCYKVSQKFNSRVMGIKSEGVMLSWYSKGSGTIKTETYDNKGKLLSSQELKSQTL